MLRTTKEGTDASAQGGDGDDIGLERRDSEWIWVTRTMSVHVPIKKKEDSDIGGSTAQEKIGQREVNDHDELNGILTASMHP